nr:SDR family NAD(P)-dependent oxidoreductase [Piscibacillus salipiscarius]
MRQTVLVIGASGEIGSAIVKELSQYSYQFILHYYQNKNVIDLISKQLDEDQMLMTVKADLSKDDLDDVMMSIPFQVDIIIFAQGKASYGLMTDMSIDELDRLYRIHLKSTVSITKNYLPQMVNKQMVILLLYLPFGVK